MMLLGLRSWLLGLLDPSVRNGLLCSEMPTLRGLFDVVGYECGSHRSILGTRYKAISHEGTLPYLSRYQMSTSIQPLSRRETNSCSFSGNASPYSLGYRGKMEFALENGIPGRFLSKVRSPGRFPIPEDLYEDNHGFWLAGRVMPQRSPRLACMTRNVDTTLGKPRVVEIRNDLV